MPITVVGLGPGSPDLLTIAAQRTLATTRTVWLRTARHPGVEALPRGPRYESFDYLYEQLDSFEAVYAAIVDRLLGLERATGTAVYAVPGDPLIAEATVRDLLDRSRVGGPEVEILSGVSFLEPVCRALALDPLAGGLQLVDALTPDLDPGRPALIAQVHGRSVASQLKLALLERYPPLHQVSLVSAASVAGEQRVETMALAELDRGDRAAHLSTLFVPALALQENRRSFGGLQAIVHRLCAPEGCPWDREQTHASLRPHLVEEAYEVLEALDEADPHALSEELGDLLLQIALHTEIADEAGEFGYSEVFEGITSKLIRRHPHVFGDVTAGSAAEVMVNWQRIKQAEKVSAASEAGDAEPESILAGVPRAMPALAYAQAVQDRAAGAGFDWPEVDGVLDKIAEEIEELRGAASHVERLDEFGDLLFVLANFARWLKIDAEEAGRLAGAKFRRRFAGMETLARRQGRTLSDLTLDEQEALWQQVKKGERM